MLVATRPKEVYPCPIVSEIKVGRRGGTQRDPSTTVESIKFESDSDEVLKSNETWQAVHGCQLRGSEYFPKMLGSSWEDPTSFFQVLSFSSIFGVIHHPAPFRLFCQTLLVQF